MALALDDDRLIDLGTSQLRLLERPEPRFRRFSGHGRDLGNASARLDRLVGRLEGLLEAPLSSSLGDYNRLALDIASLRPGTIRGLPPATWRIVWTGALVYHADRPAPSDLVRLTLEASGWVVSRVPTSAHRVLREAEELVMARYDVLIGECPAFPAPAPTEVRDLDSGHASDD